MLTEQEALLCGIRLDPWLHGLLYVCLNSSTCMYSELNHPFKEVVKGQLRLAPTCCSTNRGMCNSGVQPLDISPMSQNNPGGQCN